MAITYTDNGGGAPNGSDLEFTFTFPSLQNEDVKVALNAVVQATTKYAVDTASNPTKITFNNTSIDSNVQENTGAPKTGVTVRVFRETTVGKSSGDDDPKAFYSAGSSIRAIDLNANTEQALYAIHELQDQPITDQDIEDGAITSAKIQDGSIVNVDVSSTAAIAGTKISPDFGSQNIATTGTVDGRDVSVDGIKLDTIETNATADQTATEIRTLVESASDSNVFTDADHTKLNGIEASATADQTNAEIRAAVEAATDSNVFTDADHTKLNAIETNATADQTAGEIKNLIAGSPLDSSHLAANSVGDSELASTQLTTLAGMQSGTASKLADNVPLSADLADLNQLDGMAKQTTITDDDTKFPTSGAIVDYVAAQLAPIGGFEVIATDAAFPNTQPASGVVISIADGGGLVVNGSGTSTTGRTVGGSTVTINNFASNFNSSTVDPGVAILVSSTGSGQVYNYHKATLKEADLLSLSGDINDFAERYRVVNGEPTSGNDEGDLIYDKNADAIKVFDSSTNTFKLINSVGDFKFLFLCPTGGSGAPVFDGSINEYDLRVGSNNGSAASVSNAAQLIVSIDGVIQKPNTGTSAPSEGFAMVDSNTIIFGSNLTAGVEVFISQIGDTVNIGTPHDNTVSTAKVQNLAVTTAKIANDAVTTDKLANSIVSDITANNAKVTNVTTNLSTSTTTTAVTVASSDGTNATIGEATSSAAGVMSSTHHDKLDGIEASATADQTASEIVALVANQTIAPSTIDMADNNKIRLGTGNDLEIYHDPTYGHSFIKESGSGGLIFGASVYEFYNPDITEKMITAFQNGIVELYYDNSKKFETTSSGAKVTGTLETTSGINAGNNISLPDNIKLKAGTGDDLEIFHDGSNSRIKDVGTGVLAISGSEVHIQNNNNSQSVAKFLGGTTNSSVELYYNDSKKFETLSDGVNVTGTLKVNGSAIASGGLGNVVEDTTPQLGGTLQTNGNHIQFSDSDKAYFGTGNDLQIYHASNSSYIQNSTGNLFFLADEIRFNNLANNEAKVRMFNNGAVELYYDSSKKFETTSGGATVTGNVFVTGSFRGDDNSKLDLGSGNDLQIYHDGSDSYINDSGTGHLNIVSSQVNILNSAANEAIAKFIQNGAVELYYDNSLKLQTQSWGTSFTGNVSPSADNAYDLGATTARWNDLYVDNVRLTGNVFVTDGNKLKIGTGNDLEIYHDGSNSYIQNASAGELRIYDPSLIRLNTDDLRVYKGDGTELTFRAEGDGPVTLFYDNSTQFMTTSYGASVGENASGSNALSGLTNVSFYAGYNTTSSNSFGGVAMGAGPNGNTPFIGASRAGNQTALHLDIKTNSYTRMRVTDDGPVYVNTTTRGIDGSDSYLAVYGNSSTVTGTVPLSCFGANVSSTRYVSVYSNSTGVCGSISTNGSNTSFNTTSDYRLKENAVAISNGITRLKTLKPIRFNYIKDASTTIDGFLAHEVADVVPEAVSGQKDGMAGETYYEEGETLPTGKEYGDIKTYSTTKIEPQQLDQTKLVPLLTAALQEAITKIETLETKVAALEAS